jgi:hypothetical protein
LARDRLEAVPHQGNGHGYELLNEVIAVAISVVAFCINAITVVAIAVVSEVVGIGNGQDHRGLEGEVGLGCKFALDFSLGWFFYIEGCCDKFQRVAS